MYGIEMEFMYSVDLKYCCVPSLNNCLILIFCYKKWYMLRCFSVWWEVLRTLTNWTWSIVINTLVLVVISGLSGHICSGWLFGPGINFGNTWYSNYLINSLYADDHSVHTKLSLDSYLLVWLFDGALEHQIFAMSITFLISVS